ncbi:methionine ABC transporter permease [Nesterenkonia sphaerica]|uniref:ABC transporter permease subunit n=1 Tax=Nesterenkonia sphaerica TaxID=1804988 RepID=A0A5R9AE75_9MICC|nr:ABC transporter permease subunit [Nesterenkonia sphaerica]TLP77082.1 ABC transporter permease subunit [Nesterenkonia sphaerica]
MIEAYRELDWDYYGPELLDALAETVHMVVVAFAISAWIGLTLGLLLYTTRAGGLLANAPLFWTVNFLVNTIRPIPFIILIAALQPLTIQILGTGIGNTAVIHAMVWASSFGIARIVEQNLVTIDPGVIEAARAMGASRTRIIFTVILPEAFGPLILGFTFVIIAMIDMSALAGIVGGGGLGNFAIVEGYQRFRPEVTWLAVAAVILMVHLLQILGNLAARKVLRR